MDMKKKILGLMIVLVLTFCLCSCCKDVSDNSNKNEPSMFVCVENAGKWRIVYNKDTKVMYAVSNGGYNAGTFTLLVDENGNPMIYKVKD